MKLSSKNKTAIEAIQTPEAIDNSTEWQLIYDGKGYFKIKNRLSGKFLASGPVGSPVTLTNDIKSENVNWHFEWDGTGYCRIISKTGALALDGSTPVNTSSAVIAVKDTPSDDLRWQIVP
jgi:hypothetical protein